MTETEIKRLAKLAGIQAEIYAHLADIEGMKAENQQRMACDQSMAYTGDDFFLVKKEIEALAIRLREEI